MLLHEAYKILRTKPELSAKSVNVYLCLVNRSNWEDNTCFPGLKTIAKDCHISISSVQRALHELLLAGLIKKFNRYREDGGYSSNLYMLIVDVVDQLAATKKYLQERARKIREKKQEQIRMDEYIAAHAPGDANEARCEAGCSKTTSHRILYNLLKMFNFQHLINGYVQQG